MDALILTHPSSDVGPALHARLDERDRVITFLRTQATRDADALNQLREQLERVTAERDALIPANGGVS